MDNIQVVFLGDPKIGQKAKVLLNGKETETDTITSIRKHPITSIYIVVDTESGTIYEGPVQPEEIRSKPVEPIDSGAVVIQRTSANNQSSVDSGIGYGFGQGLGCCCLFPAIMLLLFIMMFGKGCSDLSKSSTNVYTSPSESKTHSISKAERAYITAIKDNDTAIRDCCNELGDLTHSCVNAGRPWSRQCTRTVESLRKLLWQGKAINPPSPKFKDIDKNYKANLSYMIQSTSYMLQFARTGNQSEGKKAISLMAMATLLADSAISEIDKIGETDGFEELE